ncbi:DUF3240 family protein [Thiosocius teredinicola]|uniref:DUF3240 family protein n=1 Tax=Thiosocius teredinicola TaxID=1973002 RepID=UPI0009910ACC
MSETCLLNLVVSPEVEDTVTDWLLDQPTVSGFTSHPIAGHGSSEHSMSLAEQVAGRRRQVLFKLHLPCADAADLLAAIKAAFRGSGMHYWMIPVLESGHLG